MAPYNSSFIYKILSVRPALVPPFGDYGIMKMPLSFLSNAAVTKPGNWNIPGQLLWLLSWPCLMPRHPPMPSYPNITALISASMLGSSRLAPLLQSEHWSTRKSSCSGQSRDSGITVLILIQATTG